MVLPFFRVAPAPFFLVLGDRLGSAPAFLFRFSARLESFGGSVGRVGRALGVVSRENAWPGLSRPQAGGKPLPRL